MPPPDSVFPAALDDFPVIDANSGEAAPETEHDVVHEHKHQAIKAIQATLGVTGSLVPGTVHNRLDELEAAVTELEAAIGDVELEGVVTTDTAQDILGDKDFLGRVASRKPYLTTSVAEIDDVLAASQTREVDLALAPVQTLLTEFDLTLDATGPAASAGWVVLYVYNAGASAINVSRGTGWFGAAPLIVDADETCKFHLHWDGVRMSAGLVEAAGTASGDLRPAPTVLTIAGGPLAAATEGVAYSETLTISGGAPPYSLGTVTGLPSGLSATIDGSALDITGTPDAGESADSPFSLSIEVEDAEAEAEIYTQSFVVEEPASLDAETVTWESRITTLGGSVTSGEISTADALIKAIKAEDFGTKIIYLLPFIGASIAAHRVPLRDARAVGAAALVGGTPFTDSNCDTSTGIVNATEQAAALNTGLSFASCNLSDANKGGLGFWERDIGLGTGTECMGAHGSILFDAKRFVLDLRSGLTFFSWGDPNNRAQEVTAGTSSHYYGQCNGAASRKFYKDGAQVGAENTVNDPASGATSEPLYVMGVNYENSLAGGGFVAWKGRCAVAYMTDGTLTDTEIANLHTLLDTYLVTPTGR